MCRPNGYYSVVDHEGFTDAWAFCALRLVLRHNNSGPDLEDVLFDQPLGWYDGQWPSGQAGCFKNDERVSDAYFEVLLPKQALLMPLTKTGSADAAYSRSAGVMCSSPALAQR